MNGAPELISQNTDISPNPEVALKVEKGGLYPDVSQDGMATAESLASMSKEKIEAILEKNPSLIQKLTPMLKKYWNIAQVIGEAAIIGGLGYATQWKPGGDLLDMSTPTKQVENIICLFAIAPMAIKFIYDFNNLTNNKDKKKVTLAKA